MDTYTKEEYINMLTWWDKEVFPLLNKFWSLFYVTGTVVGRQRVPTSIDPLAPHVTLKDIKARII